MGFANLSDEVGRGDIIWMDAVGGVEGDDVGSGVQDRLDVVKGRGDVGLVTVVFPLEQADHRQWDDCSDLLDVANRVGANADGPALRSRSCEQRHDATVLGIHGFAR